MNKLKNLIDKGVFVVLCVVLLAIFMIWKGIGLKQGGPGDGTGQTTSEVSQPDTQQDPDSEDQNSMAAQVTPSTELLKVAKLFLDKQGVSEDQVKWYDGDHFADFIQKLKDNGIKEVHCTLLPESIERYENKWKEELKKAKMTYVELHDDAETR